MLGLWPGGKGLPGKKHRPGGPFSRRLRPASAEWGGLFGRPAGRPLPGENPFIGGSKGWPALYHTRYRARLDSKGEAASWFLPGRSLPPGLAPDRRPPFGVAPISIRFERFTVFHTSGSARGHDFAIRNHKSVLFPTPVL
jgi:hypothetical protein